MSDFNSVEEAEQALLSGDQELQDKALDYLDPMETEQAGGDVDTGLDGTTGGDEGSLPAEPGKQGDNSQSVAADAGDQSDEVKKVIISKNGEHQYPYALLDGARKESQELRRQLDEERQARQELEQKFSLNEQAIANAKARLEKQGMDTDDVFSDPDAISEKQWQEMEEDYGSMASIMRKLYQNQSSIQSSSQSSHSARPETAQPETTQGGRANSPEVQALIDKNPTLHDLGTWEASDPERYRFAYQLDVALRDLPAWKNRPMEERFAEVIKQTKQAFGDADESQQQLDKARQSIQNAQAAIPSLSEMGSTQVSDSDSELDAFDRLPPEKQEEMIKKNPGLRDKIKAAGW